MVGLKETYVDERSAAADRLYSFIPILFDAKAISMYDGVRFTQQITHGTAPLKYNPSRNMYKDLLYFVLMCFNFFPLYKKLFAYAFGINLRTLGSCTKYS